ncbi:Sulfide:quinone oxidoreductase mitochondrial precursor [Clathrospora elynae]|uniref:Sulfide:quinone oxidoreductase mitochondrial n=1 Tax=Clathrospora elynae TaxID=706981 RepID=A0A6A5SJI3_9PLEO|nr:Sulfide:quinone oxidoreductase mitochondrial precursor [Clathrospora elynae]
MSHLIRFNPNISSLSRSRVRCTRLWMREPHHRGCLRCRDRLACPLIGRLALVGTPKNVISRTTEHNLSSTSTVLSPVRTATRNHKIVVIGGGSAGIALSHQLLRHGNFTQDDIAIVDPAKWHHYQPGWTLVGAGLKKKEELRRPLKELMNPKFKFYNTSVGSFSPEENYITTGEGEKIAYEQLVVAPGITLDYGSVKGLKEALEDKDAMVSSIYDYDYCDKAYTNIQKFKKGDAIFTQPAGVVKCAGAPQKIMWLALDYWKNAGLYSTNNSPISITFATGLPTMFGVPKYAQALEKLRVERGVQGLFQHDLCSISGNSATFTRPDSQERVTKHFSFLHVSPKNVPWAFVKNSALANEAGYVAVNDATTQHTKYPNIWSLGDASSLPTSKTVAAITAQAPVLTANLLASMVDKELTASYDGYTSCPLLTGNKEVLLAEFKYGGVPKETFNGLFGIDQGVPRKAFYYLKKDFFPWVYAKAHVTGNWGGPKGFVR